MTQRRGDDTGSGRGPRRHGHARSKHEALDRPWDEHGEHVPDEFQQAGRRADFRQRGGHENDERRYGGEPEWPHPGPGRAPRRPAPPPHGDDTGYRRGSAKEYGHDARSDRVDAPRGNDGLPAAHADTSGYDDYESEALYGTYPRGDWPRTWREAREDHSGRGPRDYRRSDERLLDDVCQQLSDDPHVDARDLSLSCKDGVVRIEGDVADRWIKHHVEHIAARCFGLQDVDNRIRVRRAD